MSDLKEPLILMHWESPEDGAAGEEVREVDASTEEETLRGCRVMEAVRRQIGEAGG